MKKYKVTLRDCVFMEKIIEVEASNADEARLIAGEKQYECEYTWDTTHIRSLRPTTIMVK